MNHTARSTLLAGLIAVVMFANARSAHAQTPVPATVSPSAADSAAKAQNPAKPKPPSLPGPPIEAIATASAVSKETFGGIAGVRELRNGNVLVNDAGRRRLIMMDTTLTTIDVVLDSLVNVRNTYGMRPGALLPYPGDSTLFVDQMALAMLVFDPQGKFVRVRSVWRIQDLNMLANPSYYGFPGFDSKGRLIYKIPAQVSPAVMAAAYASNTPYYPSPPDSAFIVAYDLSARRLDTLMSIRQPKTDYRVRVTPDGGWMIDNVTNPLPRTDEWAVLPDSRIALVRGIDYRIEYISPDGTVTSGPKLTYDWQPLDDAAKSKFIDSVRVLQLKAAETQFVASTIRWVNMYNGKYPAKFKVPEGFVVPPGLPKDWLLPPGVKFPSDYQYACAPGQSPTPPAPAPASGATGPSAPATPPCTPAPVVMGGGQAPPPPVMRPIIMVEPKELPDYRPPFTSGAVRADEDNNLWVKIVLNKPIPGGPVYDIVNPQGELTRRIQLPSGYTLLGFGRGKIVYLGMRDAAGNHLARVRLK